MWIIILFLIASIIFAYDIFLFKRLGRQTEDGLANVDFSSLPPPVATQVTPAVTEPAPTVAPTAVTLPESASVPVPFLVQAPSGNWDEVHEETCEETSLLMVAHFLKREAISSVEAGEQEIQELLSYQNGHGYKVDVTVKQLAEIAEGVYGFKKARIEPASITAIKTEIAAGRPVIVPAAGRLLPNPNFRSPGPLYHMLVVKGYDKDGFITNDPGTRKGNGFRYSYEALDNAIHDWNPDDIMKGERVFLVFDL